MGTIKSKYGYWGDWPQDAVDEYVSKMGKADSPARELPKADRLRMYRSLLADRVLFEKFKKAFKEEIGRNPRPGEYKHHVAVSLGLSATGLFGGAKLPAGFGKPPVFVRAHSKQYIKDRFGHRVFVGTEKWPSQKGLSKLRHHY